MTASLSLNGRPNLARLRGSISAAHSCIQRSVAVRDRTPSHPVGGVQRTGCHEASLGVRSRGEMGWIVSESARPICPDFADVLMVSLLSVLSRLAKLRQENGRVFSAPLM